jgi:hypothetical protein
MTFTFFLPHQQKVSCGEKTKFSTLQGVIFKKKKLIVGGKTKFAYYTRGKEHLPIK